jgi:hypothetical protein
MGRLRYSPEPQGTDPTFKHLTDTIDKSNGAFDMPAGYRPKRERDLAALAANWHVEGVGRGEPERDILPTSVAALQFGRWYIVRGGKRVDASPVQATTMDLVVGPRRGSIGPVASTKY